MKVPFLDLKGTNGHLKPQLMAEIESILDSEWYILGQKLTQFEKNYADFHSIKHCIGVGNGLDALVIALKALNVGPGDEVIIPGNTFIATALAVSYVGAKIVLVEPDSRTFNIRAEEIEKKISSKTKAIIPVHLYGQACEMEAIMDLSRKHHISVVEDNAQSQGAFYRSKMTGTWGQINATSFYPGKNLGAMGDAGAITTQDDQLAATAKMYRNYGAEKKYHHTVQGQNSRLDEIQAAILSVKLKHLNSAISERQKVAAFYDESLQGVGDLLLPQIAPGATHSYHLYVIQTQKRDELEKYLASQGVDTLVHYPISVQQQKAYLEDFKGQEELKISSRLAKTILSLPVYPGMSSDSCAYVSQCVRQFFEK